LIDVSYMTHIPAAVRSPGISSGSGDGAGDEEERHEP
jgi:hypothetical protein